MKVIVRIRPRQAHDNYNINTKDDNERSNGIDTVLEAQGDTVVVFTSSCQKKESHSHRFSYNRVFGEAARQREVSRVIEPMVEKVLQGVNCCIFAYGQTVRIMVEKVQTDSDECNHCLSS